MDILFWIVVGVVAGTLAKMVVPEERPGGIVGDLIAGVVGAVLGGLMVKTIGDVSVTSLPNAVWMGFIALSGAAIVLFMLRAFAPKRVDIEPR